MYKRFTGTVVVILVGVMASTVAFGSPSALAASCGGGQGGALLLGCLYNTPTDTTGLQISSDNIAFDVVNTYANGTGVYAFSSSGNGVEGIGGSTSGIGVYGVGNYGVFGEGGSIGVYGFNNSSGVGVEGRTSTGYGLYGENTGATGVGVYGTTGGTGSAVYGLATAAGVGVYGETTDGTGVLARSTNGMALAVAGMAQFSRSGVATVSGTPTKPKSSVRVNIAPVGANSMMVATLQKYVAGVYVVAAVPNVSGGYFTIYLNKSVNVSVGPIAWMVVEHP